MAKKKFICFNFKKTFHSTDVLCTPGVFSSVRLCFCLSYLCYWVWLEWALCTTQSHGTKLYILVSKLRSGTSKTMQLVPVHLDLPLFWKSHCATCSPVYIILYHVTGSCKGPIGCSFLCRSFAFREFNPLTLGVFRQKSALCRHFGEFLPGYEPD